ncbi:MAG: DpnD/PcfM family protein [Campylobacter sp.]|nr:DpnD/PcfM family protein [Campylobacter sp.]
MKEFEVKITEKLIKKIFIKARNKQEACKIAKTAYENCEIVLDAENFKSVEFETSEQSKNQGIR